MYEEISEKVSKRLRIVPRKIPDIFAFTIYKMNVKSHLKSFIFCINIIYNIFDTYLRVGTAVNFQIVEIIRIFTSKSSPS